MFIKGQRDLNPVESCRMKCFIWRFSLWGKDNLLHIITPKEGSPCFWLLKIKNTKRYNHLQGTTKGEMRPVIFKKSNVGKLVIISKQKCFLLNFSFFLLRKCPKMSIIISHQISKFYLPYFHTTVKWFLPLRVSTKVGTNLWNIHE